MLLHIYPTQLEATTCAYAIIAATLSCLIGNTFISTSFITKLFRPTLNFARRKYKTWQYLFCGPDMIQREFDNSNGSPFEIFAPDNRYVFVSSPDQIKELDSAADTVLSLQAASKQMLQPKYSMHGFNWFDRRGTEGVGFIKALRTLLTNNLPSIMPVLKDRITNDLNSLFNQYRISDGVNQVPIYPVIVRITVVTNALAFFGAEIAKDEEFLKSALDYVEDTIKIAEVVRLLPKFLSGPIGNLLALRTSAHKVLYERLVVAAEERLENQSLKRLGKPAQEYRDCIQWIMETSPRKNPWNARRIVHELMAIWFGSVHALSTTVTFAIHDLCLNPEYVQPLRKELESAQFSDFLQTARGLPLLDSFIKESARLTPVESMSTRRHALQPFTLSDGTRVEVGDWACTPVKALMQDPNHYPNALEFRGFRFAQPEVVEEAMRVASGVEIPATRQKEPSKLTDVGGSWHVWGTGRMGCPGRFYAAAVMKIMMATVIKKFDVELMDKEAPRWFTWRSTMLPLKSTRVVFRELRDE